MRTIALLLLPLALSAAQDINWTTYGGNLSGWRYSELAQINTDNVAPLTPKWIFQTRVPGNTEASPIVRDGLKCTSPRRLTTRSRLTCARATPSGTIHRRLPSLSICVAAK